MAQYYSCIVQPATLERGTSKAISYDYIMNAHNFCDSVTKWIPRSIIKFGETNDLGNVRIFVPMWFIRKNSLNIYKMSGFNWDTHKVDDGWSAIWEM